MHFITIVITKNKTDKALAPFDEQSEIMTLPVDRTESFNDDYNRFGLWREKQIAAIRACDKNCNLSIYDMHI